MNTKTKTYARGRRALSLLLVLIMVFGLLPVISLPTLAADDGAVTETSDELEGYLTLSVAPIINGKTGEYHIDSFFVNNYKDSKGNLIKEDAVSGFAISAHSGSGKNILVWITIGINNANKDYDDPAATAIGTGVKAFNTTWSDFNPNKPDQTIYFHAKIEGTDQETVISCVAKTAQKATAGIRYSRQGIQVRGFKAGGKVYTFGPYDYYNSQSPNAPLPNDGSHGTIPLYYTQTPATTPDTVWGTGTYPDCYFPLVIKDEVSESGAIVSASVDMEQVYPYIIKYVLPAIKDQADVNTIELFGPAVIMCYGGSQGNKYYNLGYYATGVSVGWDSGGGVKARPEQYVSWPQSCLDDFVVRRYQSVIINNVLSGSVTVNYRDSKTGELLNGTYDEASNKITVSKDGSPLKMVYNVDLTGGIDASKFASVETSPDQDNFRMFRFQSTSKVNGMLLDYYPSDMWKTIQDTYNMIRAGSYGGTSNDLSAADFASHLSFYREKEDEEGNTDGVELDPTKEELINQLQAYANKRNGFVWDVVSHDRPAPYNSRKIVRPAKCDNYVLEYGFGADGPAVGSYGLVLAGPTAEKLYVLANAVNPNPVIDLYYSPVKQDNYKIKIRLDGEIDEDLTRSYPIRFDEEGNPLPVPEDDPTVEESEKLVPEDYTIVDIVQNPDEDPMPLEPDPEDPPHNIIIIDCKSGNSYTVKVRVEGKIINQQVYFEHPVTGDKLKKGDIIYEENVDRGLAGDNKIKEIYNAQAGETPLSGKPLELDKDPKVNIIIIDCESSRLKYNVYYYADGGNKQLDHYEAEGNKGDVVRAEMRNYDGYKWDHSEGEPLTLKDSSGVIKVFYVKKASTAANAYGELKLYTDEYKTLVPKEYHSGYGFWATYEVSVPEWMYNFVVLKQQKTDDYGNIGPELQTFNYEHSPSHCAPTAQRASKQVCTYCNINWTVEFKWTDGMGTDNKIIANGNGRNVNIKTTSKDGAINDNGGKGPQLDYKLSKQRHKLVFVLPANYGPQKLPKAYIPVATKDGNSWKVEASFQYSFKQWNEQPKYSTESCPGHYVPLWPVGGYTWYHASYTWKREDSRNWDAKGPIKTNASASVKINGNMYEDDFTGGKK